MLAQRTNQTWVLDSNVNPVLATSSLQRCVGRPTGILKKTYFFYAMSAANKRAARLTVTATAAYGRLQLQKTCMRVANSLRTL